MVLVFHVLLWQTDKLLVFVVIPGHKGQLAPCCRALGTMINELYIVVAEDCPSLGLGGTKLKRPSCRRHLAGIFHTPAWCLQA